MLDGVGGTCAGMPKPTLSNDHVAICRKERQVTRSRSLLTVVAAVAALPALSGCSDSSSNQASQPTASTSTTAPQPHNQADVMFTQHMIPHHQQAIEMSDMV